MKGGLVLIVAGTWVLCQVLGGKALARLGIVSGGTPSAPSSSSGGSGSGGTYNGPGGGQIGSGTV